MAENDLVQLCGHVHDTMEASGWCDIQTRMQAGLMNDYIKGFFEKHDAEIQALLKDRDASSVTTAELGAIFSEANWEAWAKEFGVKVQAWFDKLYADLEGKEWV